MKIKKTHFLCKFSWLGRWKKKEIESIFYLFCFAYRPPDTSEYLPKEFTTKLRKKIELVNKEKKEVIIMGDLNTNYLVKDDRYRMKEMFMVNAFTQLIETATRITEETATLIDVVLTNNPLNISSTVNIAL